MPTIELSNGFLTAGPGPLSNTGNGYLRRVFFNSQGAYNTSGVLSSFSHLQLMKGSVPTNFSGLTTLNVSRVSDRLIIYSFGQSDGLRYDATQVSSTYTATASTFYKPSTQTAICTWFWLVTTDGGDQLRQQFIGTVGVTGSGADLEVPDVNFVTGVNYRVTNLNIQIPTSWTY